jgi:hypothetical protein
MQAETKKSSAEIIISANDSHDTCSALLPYDEVKRKIENKKKELADKYSGGLDQTKILNEITDYWVKTISLDMYHQWENTPWDFNGTTTQPRQGAIACGYFVATILQDMDLKVNRTKLSICASSQMMKSLVPQQRIKNLSYLGYSEFNDYLKDSGKGVYIIGLDFHTGFIVNDGTEIWFLHSNYIERKGVTKETVMNSLALKSSKTRWLISLTNDRNFLQKWLKG